MSATCVGARILQRGGDKDENVARMWRVEGSYRRVGRPLLLVEDRSVSASSSCCPAQRSQKLPPLGGGVFTAR